MLFHQTNTETIVNHTIRLYRAFGLQIHRDANFGEIPLNIAVIIANIAGNTPEEYCQMAEKLSDTDIDMIEMNISCPNVKQGGVQFGTNCAGVENITAAVRKYCKKPLMVKLSPNVTDIAEIAAAAESGL